MEIIYFIPPRPDSAASIGLPGTVTSAPIADPAGCELLALVRDLAIDEAEALEPRCHDRFTGSERISAEPIAIAQKRTYDAMRLLVDWISADPERTRQAAALLARMGGGMPRSDRRSGARGQVTHVAPLPAAPK